MLVVKIFRTPLMLVIGQMDKLLVVCLIGRFSDWPDGILWYLNCCLFDWEIWSCIYAQLF